MMSIQHEIWKPVVGYEGLYEVSNTGRVRSVTRTIVNTRNQVRTIAGTELSQDIKQDNRAGTNKYKRVILCKNGKMTHKSVHRLVAEAFISNPNNKDQVNHLDGDKTNNSVANLEWCTCSENHQHASVTGLYNPNPPKGENATFAKLTNTQVQQMRMLYDEGKMSSAELAKHYNVTECTARNALFGRSYKEVDALYPPCNKRPISKGTDSKYSKLSDADIDDIRKRFARGETQTSIANAYQISLTSVWRIVHEYRYK